MTEGTKKTNTRKSSSQAGYSAPAVRRAIQILRTVSITPGGLSISELARSLGIGKSSASGLVRDLAEEGLLVQETTGRRFHIGPALLDIIPAQWNFLRIRQRAQPVLDALRDSAGETIFLGALNLNQRRVMIIATAETSRSLNLSAVPGTTIPMMAGAVGKIFLAGMKPEEAEAIVSETGLPAYTDKSIVRLADYLADIQTVRRQGHATDNQEYIIGVRAAAVAVGNISGPPLALWLVGFARSENEAAWSNGLARAKQAAADIASLI